MTPADTTVVDWIRSAADRIPVEANPPAVEWPDIPEPEPKPLQEVAVADWSPRRQDRERRFAGLVLVAALVLAIAGAGALLVGRIERPVNVASEVVFRDPIAIPAAAPEPGSVLPHVGDPPTWFGQAVGAEREGGARTGRWTAAAIGGGDAAVTAPITISVTDGSLRWLESAEMTTLEGVEVRLVESNGFNLLATTARPTILVGGAAEPGVLMNVLTASSSAERDGQLTLSLTALPPGYSVVVQPQVQASDPPRRPTITNQDGDVAINEVSDWVDPQLAAAQTGANYSAVDVAGQQAWTGRTNFNPNGPLIFLVWSPQPGVVLEITTSNLERTVAELVELAEATSTLAVTDWHATYGT